MRKLFTLIILASAVMLVACGETLTKEEVLEQAMQASGEVESYTADVKLETTLMGMEVTIDSISDVTHNPDTLYMEMSMGMEGITMDVETYAVGDEVYMKMFGEWVIVDDEEMGLDNFDQMNEEELEKLLPFTEQLEMTEEDGHYILTLSGEGEEYEQLIETYLEAAMEDFELDSSTSEDVYGDIVISSFEMEIKIDKETKLMDAQTVHADLEVDGETYEIHVEATLSNVNEIEAIEIPDEVRENAVTEDFMD